MEYTNSQVKALIEDLLHSERDRAVLTRRLIDGVVFEKLAEEFDMSPRQIRNIVHKNEKIIFRYIEEGKA